MKRFVIAAVMVLSGLGVCSAQPGAAAKTTSQALLDLENQWTAASKAGNGDAVGALLADNFVALDSDGTMHTKAEVVARTKKAKWATNAISDVQVTVHGDSAVVTGVWIGKGTSAIGKAVDARERWVDTWVKGANGRWQCVASASALTK